MTMPMEAMVFDLHETHDWYAPQHLPDPWPPAFPVLVPSTKLPASFPATFLVDEMNAYLGEKGSGWLFEWEFIYGPASTPVVTALNLKAPDELTETEPARTPSEVLCLMRQTQQVSASTALSLTRDFIALGTPAGKPNAITRGDFGRVPVAMVASLLAARRPMTEVPAGRRPVVALLDTEVSPDSPLGQPGQLGDDSYWVDASTIDWIRGPMRPKRTGPVLQTLASHSGHGTFSAGLILQAAPDAQVLSVPVMDDDGTVHADHLLNALGWLLEKATSGAFAVDVICLPVTYDSAPPLDAGYLAWLGKLVGALGDHGIQVVAAAGNDGRDVPTFPAGFTVAAHQPSTPLVSVGAYNPNGTTYAYFSNYGEWVTDWAPGTSLVSTFPVGNAPAKPELGPVAAANEVIESADPDDFNSGYARWSGTSFAAAVIAGKIANELARVAAGSPGTAAERIAGALAAVRGKWKRP